MLAVATLLPAGCYDFVEPDLDEAGAPAVLQTTISLSEHGSFTVDATLTPALTDAGLKRNVPNDTLRISALSLAPANTRTNGTREYSLQTTLPDPAGFMRPLRIESPRVTGVRAVPTVIDWFALERVDPDTVVVAPDEELVLHLLVEPGQASPAPDQRFWMLELIGDALTVRISASGQPPTTLRVPAHWLPPHNGELSARLVYLLSGTYRPEPGDYIQMLDANLRIQWQIRVREPA